jgi:hypothetical protein
MTFDNNNREKKLRKFYEATGSKAGLWIDNATGRIVDCLPIGARFRPGSGRICFQLADIELRPTRLTIATSLRRKIQESPRPVDLVGSVPDRHAITSDARASMLQEPRGRLLLGKRGGP